MRGVFPQGVPDWVVDERRRRGEDKFDEVWDGVLHMVPPGSFAHGSIIHKLQHALAAVAKRRGMDAFMSELGLFEHDKNYRVPDVSIVRPEHCTERGLIGAELVVEVLSPHDETREKQPFYAARGVRESWIVDPKTRVCEVYELLRGKYHRVPTRLGITRSPAFGIELSIIDGPLLQIVDGDYVASV